MLPPNSCVNVHTYHSSTNFLYSRVSCFHHIPVFTRIILPQNFCIHVYHAFTTFLHLRVSRFHPIPAFTRIALPPNSCIHAYHASTQFLYSCVSCFHPIPVFTRINCLVGLVVKASASRAADRGFDSCLRRDFPDRVIPVTQKLTL